MKKLEKSISNKLKLGKYSLFEILIPIVAMLSIFMINWKVLVGDVEWVVRAAIFIFVFEFWKKIRELKIRKVRSYKAHWLIKIGWTKLNKFSNKKQFIG